MIARRTRDEMRRFTAGLKPHGFQCLLPRHDWYPLHYFARRSQIGQEGVMRFAVEFAKTLQPPEVVLSDVAGGLQFDRPNLPFRLHDEIDLGPVFGQVSGDSNVAIPVEGAGQELVEEKMLKEEALPVWRGFEVSQEGVENAVVEEIKFGVLYQPLPAAFGK